MTERDEAVGRNIAIARGDRSQQAVADLMRARGWKWSQATVWAVEKGDRPLKYLEAADLVEVLGVNNIGALLWGETDMRVREVSARASDAWGRIREAVADFLDARLDMSVLVEDAHKRGAVTRAVQLYADSWLVPPEGAITEGRAEFSRRWYDHEADSDTQTFTEEEVARVRATVLPEGGGHGVDTEAP